MQTSVKHAALFPSNMTTMHNYCAQQVRSIEAEIRHAMFSFREQQVPAVRA